MNLPSDRWVLVALGVGAATAVAATTVVVAVADDSTTVSTGSTSTSPPAKSATGAGRAGLVSGVFFDPPYDSVRDASGLRSVWAGVQVPRQGGAGGQIATSRLKVVADPANRDPRSPGTRTLRAEVRPFDDRTGPAKADGDVTDTGGYIASRAEVYDRIASGGTPAENWPDPVGSTRVYAFSVYLPKSFALSRKNWLVLTQWKGLRTGTPPVSLEVDGGRYKLGGQISKPLGRVQRGRWTQFSVTIRFSPDPSVGFVAVRMNGQQILRPTAAPTMRTYSKDGRPVVDPTYVKQGIYRAKSWTTTQVAYFSPLVIADSTRAALRQQAADREQ